ncbi:Hsp20/alpha crystallin family protein [Maribellus sp. CM-23]|uniref:Hsp20/alpha crystallin family protein n=1 Tax=Maribellus sp. CM-23 TaxID=2781026 RepID=UPI001F3972C2|nr:Hsp20/alpha crystallin family protein [Maribellus sp. CM-23]MCE4565122.1 Hsp20/alpha crystallin family protein [Maribellus sp. CM-23]
MALPRLFNSDYSSLPSFLDKFFEGNLMDWNSRNFAGTDSTLPAVNVVENKDEFQIDVAAPGMDKKDFKLNYDNGRLTISSEKKDEKEEKEGKVVTRREFSYQSFQRSFTVPENVINAEKISANYDNGILHVILPKREEVKPKPAREIKIS